MNIIEIPFEIVNLDNQQNIQPIINAYIGEHPIRLIVDTGASHSCLSKKIVKQFVGTADIEADVVMGIGRGKLNNKLVCVPYFKMGELELYNYTFLTLQITHINKMLAFIGIKPIDGLLGSDILYQYKAIIDYNSQRIFFHRQD
jgi:hypothetical protein